ncbi:MAG: hypothetical protein ACOVOV_17185 [Dolichospermum sp.]|jgi:hypothetical protein
MPLERFIPKSPDPFIRNSQDFEVAKFGHLNTIIEYINTYVAADGLQLSGTGPLSTTLRAITDNIGNTSKLLLSTTSTAVSNDFRFLGAISGYVAIEAPNSVTTYTLKLPSTTGSAGQAIITDGSGNLSFGTVTTSPSGVAGAIQFSNGSAFASDAANLFWDDTNNRLGIGTNAPASNLQVNNPTGGTTKISLSGIGSVKSELSLNYGSGECRWHNYGGGYFPTIYSNNSEALRIDNSQNVGIGTTSPTARTHIKGSGSTSATTSLLVQNSAGTASLTVNDAGNAIIAKDIFVQNVQVGRGTATGIYNTAMGQYVLGGVVGSSTASYTTAIGQAAGAYVASGIHTIIIGAEAVGIAPSVNNSVIIGSQVFAGTTSSISNTLAIGTGTSATYWPTIYATNINTDSPNVRIGNNSAARAAVPTAPTASAIFELSSTTTGFLPPRMTTAQRTAIVSPAAGLIVYDTDTNKSYTYDGTAWQAHW